MTEEVKKIIREVLDSSDEEKVDLGKEALGRLTRGLIKGGIEEEKVPTVIIGITRLFVSADKHCSSKEYYFFNEVTELGMSYDDFYELTNGGSDEEYVNATLEFLSILREEDKLAVIIYGIALLSSDDVVKPEELSIIDRIIN